MDLSMLPTPVSEYEKQRTGARFTVRSANSPSYSLTCGPGVRKPRCFLKERETTEELGKKERYGTHTGTNGTNKEDRPVTGYHSRNGSQSSVKGQYEEKETSGNKMSTKLNQNGTADKTTTEFGTDRSRNCNPAFEKQDRTDWRRYNLLSRSKSLDWRTGVSSPGRGKISDTFMLSTKRGLDERKTGVEGVRTSVMSSVQAYNSEGTSNVRERSPVKDTSKTLDVASKGHSLPTRLRSLSGPGSGVRGTSTLFGPKGGQSIMERIERLYSSAGYGKLEDCSKINNFSTPVVSHYQETTPDILTSSQQSSYDRASEETLPRHFLSGEKSSHMPVQSKKSFTCTQKVSSKTLLSPETSRTRERFSGCQWQGKIQGRCSEEEGVNCVRGSEEMGTRSLDRAWSRSSVAAKLRSARASKGINAPPLSNTFLEEERSVSLSNLSGLRERRANGTPGGMKGETNGITGKLREITGWLEEEEIDVGAKENNILNNSSSDEDVFESKIQKITMKPVEKKGLPTASAASVRNKINQFEALTQRVQGLATGQVLVPRRAFSVPTQLSCAHGGVKKSGSAKAIDGLRYKWEGLKEREEAGNETEETFTGARKEMVSQRSLSVDEVGLRLGRKAREGNVMVENEEKGTYSSNNCAEDFGKYSRLKSTLQIPLYGGAQTQRRKFHIDETDFYKISSPEEANERPQPSLLFDSCDTSAGVHKTTSTRVVSPVSDEDKTPTNSSNHSPFLSPTTANIIPFAESGNESTSVLTQAAKASGQNSPRPLATSSHSNFFNLISPDVDTAAPHGNKQVLDAWVAGWNPDIKGWNDDEDDYDEEDDDESTQRDEDSNYDSDSGESSVTITSNMSQSDHKSFCVRLSDLCNFAGVENESEDDSNDWQYTSQRTASLSSDMSALSCVSVMPSEELDRLLEDVRSVGDSTLQDYDDVQVVVLHKDIGVGLGFSVAGGVDQNKPVTVHKVFHSGVAAQEGSIREGDQVLSINGTSLGSYAHWEALKVLRRTKTREMGVVVLRRGENSGVCKRGAQRNNQGPTQTQFTETGQLLCVRLEKNSRDLGFSLEGGVDSNLGNRPLTVQKIFQGGPVDKVCPGDEVEEIDGMSVVGMRRLEVWSLIRKLPSGPVDLVLRRHPKHLET
ncbi:uncharacterized protein si:dkey-92i15.4 isoform X2 [Etheostoma cragini]|uniref:uncharacterized protein si:dkey-92i15.4 isoform X1 n=1 Tax=Etheostoma cragini TaxID=417921 RepID=UPI00155F4618|nr:uncharacterized protein si:dkey-92i15.4 isoform X1 [Etheostoma cragini]XP_034730592.1 uncharacterized protein si:dkey-92i15.4 isoform X1 [Etheostoma cragini]XP_034730593.1 uncharacterized protein si:dkey-92i15.4 isoform X2 [Etheostoma cragini]